MPDINTMLNAAYDAYEAVIQKNKDLQQANEELTAKINALTDSTAKKKAASKKL